MKSLRDFDVKNKRVLLRCDFNVPLQENGEILDDTKIKEALPTINYLVDGGAKVIIITHLGDGSQPLDKVKVRLFELLALSGVERLGSIEMLENIRNHKEEMENDEGFAKKLAELGDIYINEAFDVCHRNHASVCGIPKFLPHGAGFLLEKEVNVLTQIMQRPQRPMAAIIGGAKAATKAAFVDPFCAFADVVIVNGLIKQELITKKIPLQYPEKIISPKNNLEAFDISDEDIKTISARIMQAKTIFWNGPFGKIEEEQYTGGTRAIAKVIIESGAFSVVGGGETVAFLKKEDMIDRFNHVSTAGGSLLEFLSGQLLPGLAALDR